MTFIRVLVDTDKSEVCEAYERLLEQVKEIMREEQGVPESKQVRLSVQKPDSDANNGLHCCSAILTRDRDTSTRPIFDIADKQSISPSM